MGARGTGLCLTVIQSPDAGLTGVVPLGESWTIGRLAGEGIDRAVSDRLLSRRHATVQQVEAPDLYELIDHESSNGSFVDGERVTQAELRRGSIIRLGVTLLEVDRMPRADAAELLAAPHPFHGRSAALADMLARIAALAASPSNVLLVGEAGAGKELAAHHIHDVSARSGEFVGVRGDTFEGDMDARLFGRAGDETSPGLFVRAAGGTLFVDAIDALPKPAQELLTATLEAGAFRPVGGDAEVPLEARIVASASSDLEACVKQGIFSEALFDLVAGKIVEVPSLRERRSDIPLLARHFLDLHDDGRSLDWSPTFLEKLLLHDWPLNVQGLESLMQRLTTLEPDVQTLRSAHLPKGFSRRSKGGLDTLRASGVMIQSAPSRADLVELLTKFEGDVDLVAKYFMATPGQVGRWLSRHDLSAADYLD